MSFVLFLSIIAMTTAVVGCAAIWGFDVARAREVERDIRANPHPGLPASEQRRAVEAREAQSS